MKTHIKEFREKLGMSQEELAEKAGVSRTTIWKLENNLTDVTTSATMLKISKVLNASIDDIFYPKGLVC